LCNSLPHPHVAQEATQRSLVVHGVGIIRKP
jgi:hypothetical protein